MTWRNWLPVLAAVWLTAFGAAAVLIRVFDLRPVDRAAGARSTVEATPVQEADEPVVAPRRGPVLQMPVVTIVAPRPGGVAEMQGPDRR